MEKNEVAPASRGSFRASRPKPAMDEARLCWCNPLRSYARQPNSAGRRIEPAGGGCYPQLSSSLADARLQFFFQTGQGAVKGVVVLPVREIGEVIFVDFFRQSFAGDGSWIFPRAFLCPLDADALNNENNSSAPKNNCHNTAKQQ